MGFTLLVMSGAVIYKAISFPDSVLPLVPDRKSKQTLAGFGYSIGFSVGFGELPTACKARCIF